MMRRRIIAGFTLIELLVVIAIISILAAILTSNFGDARELARNRAAQATFKEVQLAIELYRAQERRYPAAENVTNKPIGHESGVTFVPDYIDELPNPADSANSDCEYVYQTDANGTYYKYTAEHCFGGAEEAAEGIQPDDELARCPGSCVNNTTDPSLYCTSANYNSVIAQPSFYESFAIYSLGGECR